MYSEPLPAPESDVPTPKLARALLAIAVVALLVGGAMAVISRPSKADPDKELASVRSFVGNARTAHVVTDEVDTYGNATGPGSSSTERFHSEGDLRLPDEAHLIQEDGHTVTEVIAVKKGVYTRDAKTRPEVLNKGWVFDSPVTAGTGMASASGSATIGSVGTSPVVDGQVDTALGAAAATFDQVMASGAGMGLPHVLAALKDPVRVDTHVLRATLDIDVLMRSFGMTDAQITEMKRDGGDAETAVTVTITSGANGRLDRVLWKAVDTSTDPEANGVSTDDSVFSSWDAPVTITAPGRDALDLTPDVDEQGVAAVHDIALLAPTTLPAAFKLTYADVTTADDSTISGCRTVNLTFSDPVADEAAYSTPPDPAHPDDYPTTPGIELYEVAPDCPSAPKLEGQPYVAGANHGFTVPADGADWGIGDPPSAGRPEIDVVMKVGNTLVMVSGTVPAAQLTSVLASLAPLDLTKITIATVEPPA
jgi:hypothetical protein